MSERGYCDVCKKEVDLIPLMEGMATGCAECGNPVVPNEEQEEDDLDPNLLRPDSSVVLTCKVTVEIPNIDVYVNEGDDILEVCNKEKWSLQNDYGLITDLLKHGYTVKVEPIDG
jgi:hypothetical protein